MAREICDAGLCLLLTAALLAEGFTTRVRFQQGSSGARLQGALARGEESTYILGAAGGQTMAVTISSVEGNAVFHIIGSSAKPLAGAEPGKDATRWQGQVQRDGDYRVVVGATRGGAEYTLQISIK